ncbi:conserved hypothetical protein [Denitrovibrio acetiphilus DSM 12809]|uniref:DUF2023 domain-containing protein n=1 Tax=Denitrovibrio acetiphilus (strain DSM 12809 / NBRC 114555 / N2460) TaxID=522772 RepID=D4H6W9_DENA2|nr:DUF2023 family protein [Denitrovibrio acetiphilus]ADD67835.1 conserved hypothetical protein [Denitrovibrio acetiphilus DSM 12809]
MQDTNLRLFSHMVYEYKKGVRRLAMYTCSENECEFCIKKLEKSEITYMVATAGDGKSNIFFGDCPCISILESFGKEKLNEFDQKEDFILGILLGYDVTRQCERYISMSDMDKCMGCSVSTQQGA